MKRLLLVLGFASLVTACSGKSDTPALAKPPTPTGGSTSDTGGRAHTGVGGTSTGIGGTGTGVGGTYAGGSTGVGGVSAGGVGGIGGTTSTAAPGGGSALPVITILSPLASLELNAGVDAGADAGSDMNIGPVLVDTPVEVRCQAAKSTAAGAADIAGSSVQLSMQPDAGTATTKAGGPVANLADTYSANFAISDVPTGSVDFTCKASDQLTPPNSNSATISTFVDHGPVISKVVPAPNAAFPVKNSVHFEFQLTPQELVPGDTGAQIGDVSLKVSDVTVSAQPDSLRPGYYTAEVNFGDATKFSQGLSGRTAVVITAANQRRNPKPAVATDSFYILLDGDPPTINITSPAATRIIGGQTQLTFSVTDALSGVDPKMVFVDLGTSNPVRYPYAADDPAWTSTASGSTTNFTFTFDTTKFDKTDSQVTVSISAADLAGNQSTSETTPYYLDNQPPFVSLDPPNVRLLTPAGDIFNCSTPFDPLGPRMPNDRTIVNSFEFYRAFAWDDTNGKESQTIFYFAGVDPAFVQLFVQATPANGIIYDKSYDGDCDSISDAVTLLSGQPRLDPVTETGTALNDTAIQTVSGYTCTTQSNDPKTLCKQNASDMTLVVHQEYAGQTANDAAVYAYTARKDTLNCTGLDWDISKFAKEGWVCLAAEASDGIGNIGISAPIAVCYDDETPPNATHPDCAYSDYNTAKEQLLARHDTAKQGPPQCIQYQENLDQKVHPELDSTIHPELKEPEYDLKLHPELDWRLHPEIDLTLHPDILTDPNKAALVVVAQQALMARRALLADLNGYCRPSSKSKLGDIAYVDPLDPSTAYLVPYDIGNPASFYIKYH